MGRATGPLTILIVARNAGATIGRAIVSCLPESDCRIVLVDDHSTDDTIEKAHAAGGPRVTILGGPDPGGVAVARQQALDALPTPYGAWLDADDEWIPGRADRLTKMLDAGADVATESIDLHDGPSGAWLRRIDVPSCIKVPGGFVRLFERNLLPGDSQVAFRAQAYRSAGGYDGAIRGPESYDVLLRLAARGGRLTTGSMAGYRMYAYPDSLSRGVDRQRAHLAVVLRKHEYEAVRQLYLASGHPEKVAVWALVTMATFRNEHQAALRFLDQTGACDAGASDVLEPDGPWPFPEAWRYAFHRGSSLLALGEDLDNALDWLRRAEAIRPTAEGVNNLGVALARTGEAERAAIAFATAAHRFPGYLDATLNAAAASPERITTHPLRHLPSRDDYHAMKRSA